MNTKLLGAAFGALLAGRPAPLPIPAPLAPAAVVSEATTDVAEATLLARIVAAFEASDEVDADQLAVTANGTVVTLEGEVTTAAQVEAAILLAYEAGATQVIADFEGFDGGGASD